MHEDSSSNLGLSGADVFIDDVGAIAYYRGISCCVVHCVDLVYFCQFGQVLRFRQLELGGSSDDFLS